MLTYAWRPGQTKRPQHILGPDGHTYCQLENIKRRKKFRPLSKRSDIPAPDRPICRNCLDLAGRVEPTLDSDTAEPDLAVLMGERIA